MSDQQAQSFAETMKTVMRFTGAVEAMAAVGAQLALAGHEDTVDPGLAAAVAKASALAGLPDISDIPPLQRAMALGLIRTAVREADLFLADPGKAPGWTYTDPLVVEGWGRASMMIPGLIAATLPDFEPPGSFLDVGVGVGWLAVQAANMWPGTSVTGLDIWEPSLERARTNVDGSGHGARIDLRTQDVCKLEDEDAYDLAWIPTFFLNDDQLPKAVGRVVASLRPGGKVVLGHFEPAPDPLGKATGALRTLRAGGVLVDSDRCVALLKDAGCSEAQALPKAMPVPILLAVGTK